MANAQTRAKRKYNEANYFRVALTIPIRQAEPLKHYAASQGLTVNKLLNNFITSILTNTDTSINIDTNTSEDSNTSTSIDSNTSTSIDSNTNASIDSNTSTSIDSNTNASIERRKQPAAKATKEEIVEWSDLHTSGMKWNEIAKQANRNSDAVRKAVQRYKKSGTTA